MSTSRDIRISRLEAVILDFLLPVTSDSIPTSTVGFLAPENMGVAVDMVCLSCEEAEIRWGVVTTPLGISLVSMQIHLGAKFV